MHAYTCCGNVGIHAYTHACIHTTMQGDRLKEARNIKNCAYIHTYIHTHMHTYIHTYMQGDRLKGARNFKNCAYIHTYIHTHTHAYIHTYMQGDRLKEAQNIKNCAYIHTYIHAGRSSQGSSEHQELCIHTYIHTCIQPCRVIVLRELRTSTSRSLPSVTVHTYIHTYIHTCIQGDRLKEAQNINKSLSALGDCVQSLVSKSKHVPFRNSKLTHLLQVAIVHVYRKGAHVCVYLTQ
jgi:hypothetical protein